jgi:hypothetical protein
MDVVQISSDADRSIYCLRGGLLVSRLQFYIVNFLYQLGVLTVTITLYYKIVIIMCTSFAGQSESSRVSGRRA